MAPIATSSVTELDSAPLKLHLRGPAPPESVAAPGRNTLPGPLPYNESLDHYPHFEVTPSIGREFGKELQLTDLLNAPNSDELIRDLAVLSKSSPRRTVGTPLTIVSRRGVCFFRSQECSQDAMLDLADRLGRLTGRPKDSGSVIHPVSEYTPELLSKPTTQLISADRQRKGGGINR